MLNINLILTWYRECTHSVYRSGSDENPQRDFEYPRSTIRHIVSDCRNRAWLCKVRFKSNWIAVHIRDWNNVCSCFRTALRYFSVLYLSLGLTKVTLVTVMNAAESSIFAMRKMNLIILWQMNVISNMCFLNDFSNLLIVPFTYCR